MRNFQKADEGHITVPIFLSFGLASYGTVSYGKGVCKFTAIKQSSIFLWSIELGGDTKNK